MPEDVAVEGELLDGKYEIQGLIGKGGMGAVYRARHVRLDAPRAIKLIRDELADDDDFVRRFRNEALLAEGIRHPNVVALFDFATLPDGTKYIVWEYVEGETVGELLSRGVRFPPHEVARLVGQVASGLATAHHKGILHRDVSPDNIMLCDAGNGLRAAKLLDFGVAKMAGYPSSIPSTLGMVVGKIGYASPEQMGLINADELLDARTDVFSLAAVTYAMLTGEPPFRSSSFTAFLHDLMIAPEENVRGRFLARLEPAWRDPLARALARDRDARPASIEAFAADVERAAHAPAISSPVERPRRRRRLTIVAAAAAAVILAAFVYLRPAPGESSTVDAEGSADPPVIAPVPQELGKSDYPGDVLYLRPSVAGGDNETNGEGSRPPDTRSLPPGRDDLATVGTRGGNETGPAESASLAPSTPIGSPSPDPAVEIPDERGEELSVPSEEVVESAPAAGEASSGVDETDVPVAERPAAPESEPETLPGDAEGEPREQAAAVTQPVKLNEVKPQYPAIARRLGLEGVVVLSAVITEEGAVTELEVVTSIPLLDDAALEAARQFRYRPATKNGVPIPMRVTLTVSFRMNE